MYKRGTPEYAKWRKSPEYDLYCKRISVTTKGKRNPMYGKHHSEKTITKISAAHTGKHLSIETRAKIGVAMTGEQNPMYGKQHSVETFVKMRTAKTGKQNPFYGKHHSVEARARQSAAKTGKQNSNYGKHPNAETRAKQSAAASGSNNHAWLGGVSFLPYPVNWTIYFRETIRRRDNYTCALCGKEQNERKHSVHHINYDKEDICPENLITLCTVCHLKTNNDREYWQNLFDMIYVPDFPKERITKNESCC